jgi:sugar phosphate permease
MKKDEPRRGRALSTVTSKYRKQKEREMRKVAKMVENYTIKQKVIFLLTNFNFMVLLIALTGIYYLTTGIQFWITDYLIIVLGISKSQAFTTFAVCSLTGPILGVVLGGFFFT